MSTGQYVTPINVEKWYAQQKHCDSKVIQLPVLLNVFTMCHPCHCDVKADLHVIQIQLKVLKFLYDKNGALIYLEPLTAEQSRQTLEIHHSSSTETFMK